MRRVVTVIVLPLLLAACATRIPDQGEVSITTAANGRQFDGARCIVATESGSWQVVTPAKLTLQYGQGDLRVACSKQGYRASELILPPYAPLPGAGPVAAADGDGGNIGLGASYNFPQMGSDNYYPTRVVVSMHRL